MRFGDGTRVFPGYYVSGARKVEVVRPDGAHAWVPWDESEEPLHKAALRAYEILTGED